MPSECKSNTRIGSFRRSSLKVVARLELLDGDVPLPSGCKSNTRIGSPWLTSSRHAALALLDGEVPLPSGCKSNTRIGSSRRSSLKVVARFELLDGDVPLPSACESNTRIGSPRLKCSSSLAQVRPVSVRRLTLTHCSCVRRTPWLFSSLVATLHPDRWLSRLTFF